MEPHDPWSMGNQPNSWMKGEKQETSPETENGVQDYPLIIHVKIQEAEHHKEEGTIVFRIITQLQEKKEVLTYEVMRNYDHLVWLYDELKSKYTWIMFPALPEVPSRDLLTDPLHIEKKRRQCERLLMRLCTRDSIAKDIEVHYFLTNLTPQVIHYRANKRGSTSGILGKMLNYKYDLGIRVYTPARASANWEEQQLFDKMKHGVLTLEKSCKDMVNAMHNIVRIRADLGKDLKDLSEGVACLARDAAQIEKENTLQTEETLTPFENNALHFYQFAKEWNSIDYELAKGEVLTCSDIFVDYKNGCDSFKEFLNRRTELHIKLDECTQMLAKKREEASRLKTNLPTERIAIEIADAEVSRSAMAMRETEKDFEEFQTILETEMKLFHQVRSEDMALAIKHFTQLNRAFEGQRLKALDRLKYQLDEACNSSSDLNS